MNPFCEFAFLKRQLTPNPPISPGKWGTLLKWSEKRAGWLLHWRLLPQQLTIDSSAHPDQRMAGSYHSIKQFPISQNRRKAQKITQTHNEQYFTCFVTTSSATLSHEDTTWNIFNWQNHLIANALEVKSDRDFQFRENTKHAHVYCDLCWVFTVTRGRWTVVSGKKFESANGAK